ncbi:MAG: hypothetical protein IJZ94_04795 [Clostridia bacterium]|nr:hypothetical protein [Clostridia bacterium]
MTSILGVKGVPVVCLKDDSRVGYIGDALYDNESKVCAFILEQSGITLRKRMILLEEILQISNKNCVIYSDKSILKFDKKIGINKDCRYSGMIGKNVEARSGGGMGVIRDMVFDVETGTIEGFELYRGLMEDAVKGRNIIYFDDGIEVFRDYVIAGKE